MMFEFQIVKHFCLFVFFSCCLPERAFSKRKNGKKESS